jgi:hypothetical protein
MQMPMGNPFPYQGIFDSSPFSALPVVSSTATTLRSPPSFCPHSEQHRCLTVRLLEAGAGTLTTELLGLAAAVVGNEEGSVELDEGLLEEVLGVLVDELLVVGDEGLGDGLTDGVDLRGVTTTGDADTDVDVGELVKTDNQEGLVDLLAEVSAFCSFPTSPHSPRFGEISRSNRLSRTR